MNSKPVLPSIADDLAQSSRPRVNLRGLKARQPIDEAAIEANSQALGERWKASTSLKPSEPETAEADPGDAVPLASLRLEIPEYLDNELTLRAAQNRVTKAFLVMTALAGAGYRIDPKDLIPDRRKSRSKKV